jgi:hypothetical protein
VLEMPMVEPSLEPAMRVRQTQRMRRMVLVQVRLERQSRLEQLVGVRLVTPGQSQPLGEDPRPAR